MPIEYELLKDAPYEIKVCPNCHNSFEPFLRGLVQSTWRRILRMSYCTLICDKCKDIVGYEKPPKNISKGKINEF